MEFVRRNVLRSSAVAAALMTKGMLAMAAIDGSSPVDTSIAFCSVSASSSSGAISQSSYTEAWEDVAVFVCGSESTLTNIDIQVERIAFAIAEAFAEVTAFCSAKGNAEVRAQAYAFAQARADAIGESIASTYLGAEACGTCSAAMSATAFAVKELVAEAVAEAWTEIYIYSDSGSEVPVEEYSKITSDIIDKNIVRVLSGITGTIRAGADEGCSIELINEASVGDFFGRCELFTSGEGSIIETDAIAQAGANASAYACSGDRAAAEIDTIAKATAVAVAEAISQTEVYCESSGPLSSACGLAQSEIAKAAEAQAEVFAFAFAEASTCNCNVAAYAETEVWAGIWVAAAVNSYAEVCVEGDDYGFDEGFQAAFEERTISATARAIASAIAIAEDADECSIAVSPCAAASDTCIDSNRQCGGRGFDYVQPCCDPDYRCYQRNSRDFRCRRKGSRLPSFWDGTLQECTADQA